MPRRKRTSVKVTKTTTVKKSTGRKKKSSSKNWNLVPKTSVNMGLHFPKTLTMIHRYNQSFGLSPAASAFAYQDFICNGIYDVDLSGTGHQPYYTDQLKALYNHWTVIGSRMKVRMTPSAISEDPCFIGVYINDDTTHTPGDVEAYNEIAGPKTNRMTPPGMDSVYEFNINWSGKKAFKRFDINNKLFRGSSAVSENPEEQQVYTVYCYPVGAAGVSFYINVTIEYIVVWTELKDIAGS